MSKTKHTPGPWTALYSLGAISIHQSPGMSPVAALYEHTAEDCKDSFDNAQANATLIAAAPEMLEALEQLILDTESLIFTDELTKSRLKNAKRVVTKARGES